MLEKYIMQSYLIHSDVRKYRKPIQIILFIRRELWLKIDSSTLPVKINRMIWHIADRLKSESMECDTETSLTSEEMFVFINSPSFAAANVGIKTSKLVNVVLSYLLVALLFSISIILFSQRMITTKFRRIFCFNVNRIRLFSSTHEHVVWRFHQNKKAQKCKCSIQWFLRNDYRFEGFTLADTCDWRYERGALVILTHLSFRFYRQSIQKRFTLRQLNTDKAVKWKKIRFKPQTMAKRMYGLLLLIRMDPYTVSDNLSP